MGVTNRRPSSDSELISRMEMRFLACVTRGPSRDPYQTVSRKNIEGGGVLGQTRPNHTLLNLVEGTFLVLLAVSRAELQRSVLKKPCSHLLSLRVVRWQPGTLHDWFDLLDGIDCTPSVQKQWQTQRAKKVVFDSPGLVDFAIGLVFLGGKNSNYRGIVINPPNQKGFWG